MSIGPFKSSEYQIGRITRALTSDASGNLIFRDNPNPDGISLSQILESIAALGDIPQIDESDKNIKVITPSTYNATANDGVMLCSCVGTQTIILPVSPTNKKEYTFKKILNDTNDIIIQGNGNTIDGMLTKSFHVYLQTIRIKYIQDNVYGGWYII